MINHVTYEVDGELLVEEVAFWKAIGWEEVLIRNRQSPLTRWLRTPIGSAAIHIHLIPTEDFDEVEPAGHICIVPPVRVGGFAGAMRALDALEFTVEVEEAEPWWGARRVFLTSPSGWRVEMLESEPPAGRPLPPETD